MRISPAFAVAVVAALCATTLLVGVDGQHMLLEPLPYAYDALEPVIDEATMRLHHLKHHAGYLSKLNAALESLRSDGRHKEIAKRGVDWMLRHLDEVPEEHRRTVRNMGGGFVNHALFWNCMQPPAPVAAEGERPSLSAPRPGGPLEVAAVEAFGSVDKMRAEMISAAAGLFGSGWVFLYLERTTAGPALRVGAFPNQDTPAMGGHVPLLAIDLWEHSYYLKYQSDRARYVEQWFRVANWDAAERLLVAATANSGQRDL